MQIVAEEQEGNKNTHTKAIQLLSSTLVDQIAAGEVVDRPLSVVRELVENALDATATSVEVHIEAGGRARIEVKDNGAGIAAKDIPLAVARHATSKIATIQELQELRSLGFRGEALSSIASVSRFQLSSRSKLEPVGIKLSVDGGSIVGQEKVARSVGTTVEVSQLFFNTPARRKFLKTERYEKLSIKRWMETTALVWPQRQFRFVADGKEELFLPSASSFNERAMSIFGEDLVFIDVEYGELRLQGATLKPAMAVKDRNQFSILLNGRKISDLMIQRAIRDGFGSLLRQGLYPKGYLHLVVPPETVDLNVHPQKTEVRFAEPSKIFIAVRRALSTALSGLLTPNGEQAVALSTNETRPLYSHGVTTANRSAVLSKPLYIQTEHYPQEQQALTLDSGTVQHQQSLHQTRDAEKSSDLFSRIDRLKFCGQLFSCFLFFEDRDECFVVDMHAAHERINFNLLRSSFQSRNALDTEYIATEQLLIPLSIEVGEEAVHFFADQRELFLKMGFDVEPFGTELVAVRSCPAFFPSKHLRALFLDIADSEIWEEANRKYEVFLERLWSTVACHKSLRAGDILSKEESFALLLQLRECPDGLVCPHGRPVVTTLAKEAVEQWFARHRYG